MKFTDCLRGKPELRDYNSLEKDIIKEKFNTIPYMDVWICSIIEGYIYEKVTKVDERGYREEYMERNGKPEGEYKKWFPKMKLLYIIRNPYAQFAAQTRGEYIQGHKFTYPLLAPYINIMRHDYYFANYSSFLALMYLQYQHVFDQH